MKKFDELTVREQGLLLGMAFIVAEETEHFYPWVPGVARNCAIHALEVLGVPVEEKNLTAEALAVADELVQRFAHRLVDRAEVCDCPECQEERKTGAGYEEKIARAREVAESLKFEGFKNRLNWHPTTHN